MWGGVRLRGEEWVREQWGRYRAIRLFYFSGRKSFKVGDEQTPTANSPFDETVS